MKNKDNLEDLLRGRFENEEIPVSGRVWENIKKTLPPEKPARKPYPMYISIIAGLGLIATLISILIDKEARSLTKEPEAINSHAYIKDWEIEEKIKEDQQKNISKSIFNYSEISNEEKFNNKGNHQESSNKKSIILKDPLVKKGQSILDNKHEVNGSNTDIANSISIEDSSDVMAPNILEPDLSELFLIQAKNPFVSENNNASNEKSASLTKGKIQEDFGLNNSGICNKNEGALNNYKDNINSASVKAIDFNKKESTKEVIDSIENSKLEELQSKSKNKRGNKTFLSQPISIDIFTTPLISYRTISAPIDIKNDLNTNEKPRINMGAGIKINFDLNEKWKLGMGVNYVSYGERYKLGKDFYKEKTAYFGYYQQDSTGAFVVKTDSSKYLQKYSAKVKNNYYKYIGIPFYVTRILSEGKVGVAVTAGASINFLIRAYTSRVNALTDTVIAVIEESSQSQSSPFRRMTSSAFLTSTISYEISSRSKVFLEPGITYFINSTYNSDYPVKRHIYAFQLMAGIRFILKE